LASFDNDAGGILVGVDNSIQKWEVDIKHCSRFYGVSDGHLMDDGVLECRAKEDINLVQVANKMDVELGQYFWRCLSDLRVKPRR
jgi:hypothetical protein